MNPRLEYQFPERVFKAQGFVGSPALATDTVFGICLRFEIYAMTAPAYLFQMSTFFRMRMSTSPFVVRVGALPNASRRLRAMRSTRCLSTDRTDEDHTLASGQTDSSSSVPSNTHSIQTNSQTPPALESTQHHDQLLSAFESYIDDIEVETERKLAPSKGNNEGKSKKFPESSDAHLRRLDILASLPHDLVVEPANNKCPGCGSVLQSETPERPGYLPQTVVQDSEAESLTDNESIAEDGQVQVPPSVTQKEPICQRCYRLTHYGTIESHLRVRTKNAPPLVDTSATQTDMDTDKKSQLGRQNELSPAKFRKSLERLRNLNAVIIYLVDIFDFHGTFIPSLRDIIGNKNPVILAVNKTDLLPKNYKASRVEGWIEQECSAMGLRDVAGIHLVSSTRGTGLNRLLADALKIAKRRRSDVYVIGAANVGKSSFINQLIRIRKRDGLGRGAQSGKDRKRGQKPNSTGAITTSVVPGTTLDMIRIRLGGNVSLFDTPGLMMPHQLTNYLDAKELRAVLPSKTVEHVTFRLGEGKALYVGGLARLEVMSGKPFFFTCFFAPTVKVHPGKVEGAEEFALRHVGELLTPPYSEDRFVNLGEWTSKSFTAEGGGWKKSCVDIVLSGLGWISVTGPGSVRLRVWVPRGVGVFTREPLMPFEAETGVSKYTGTAAVNKKQMRKATERRRGNAREQE